MAEDFDPCECIFSHDNAMQRLINLLRSSQSQCTDNECFNELPGLQGSTPSAGGEYNFFLLMIGWVVLALALYFMRPSAMRNNTDGKPNNNNGPSSQPPGAIF